MQRELLLFDELLAAVCQIGEKIRNHQWTDEGVSINEWKENCKNIADFIYSGQKTDENAHRIANLKVAKGEWFVSKDFRRVIVHMQLLQEIEKKNYSVEMDLVETLLVYLGNAIYYDKCKLNEMMGKVGSLYLAALKCRRIYKSTISDNVKLLITAVKELKKEEIQFKIVQGEPIFEQDSEEEKLVSKLDSMIKQVGGLFVIKRLFDDEIMKRDNAILERYLIYRNKRLFRGNEMPESRIPFQYLLQLSLKHLSTGVPLSEAYMKSVYDKIIHLSTEYLEVLQLQGYSVMEEMFEPVEYFPYRLSKNICFEKMYIPRQYHPDYIKMLLHNMLEPFYLQGVRKPRCYSFFNYMKMTEYILENANGPRFFLKDELKDAVGISEYKLNTMLQDISMDAEKVNSNFLHYLDATNTWEKPLIKMDDDRYFCLDRRFSGYGFYEVMFQILHHALHSEFSKKQGEMLEKMVYKIFQDKKFNYITGRYKEIGNLPERDCDMILETEEQVMFIEIKKCPLPRGYEQGDDVEVLRVLGEGMLYAQEQILWHKLRIKERGVLELYDKGWNHLQDYTPGKKTIMAVSICMPEYDFLTERNITENFLESTLLVEYKTVDLARENLLKRLNDRALSIRNITERLLDGKPFDVREVFFDSQFRSLQQIWTILRFCNTLDDFFDMCKQQLLVVTGAGDVYVEILNMLQLRDG